MKLTPSEQLDILEKADCIPNFKYKLDQISSLPLVAQGIDTLQINVGRLCNLSCKHCHVEAGPNRKEILSEDVFEQCFKIVKALDIPTVDITGGAPEMNPYLEGFINKLANLNTRVIVRSNLVILAEEPYTRFIDIFANNNVELVCSLPDFRSERTDRMRGKDAFKNSIDILRHLNERGYGKGNGGLKLNLVHNVVGAYLPVSQITLEKEYKLRLFNEYGINFNSLFCLNNMPIGRYLDYLLKTDNYKDYLQLLVEAFNPVAVDNVMCRSTVSVGWDGQLYDCDFNQMLHLPIDKVYSNTVYNFDINKLKNREIVIYNHCYGCTAGSGSSCQGAIDS